MAELLRLSWTYILKRPTLSLLHLVLTGTPLTVHPIVKWSQAVSQASNRAEQNPSLKTTSPLAGSKCSRSSLINIAPWSHLFMHVQTHLNQEREALIKPRLSFWLCTLDLFSCLYSEFKISLATLFVPFLFKECRLLAVKLCTTAYSARAHVHGAVETCWRGFGTAGGFII